MSTRSRRLRVRSDGRARLSVRCRRRMRRGLRCRYCKFGGYRNLRCLWLSRVFPDLRSRAGPGLALGGVFRGIVALGYVLQTLGLVAAPLGNDAVVEAE